MSNLPTAKFLPQFKLGTKAVLCAVLLIAMNTALVVGAGYWSLTSAFNDRALRDIEVNLRTLALAFAETFPDAKITIRDGAVQRAEIPKMPDLKDHAIVDRAVSYVGGNATLFMFDAASGQFVRRSTNVKKENGDRAVGTQLAADHPGQAPLRRGEAYKGPATLFGKTFMTAYFPVLDATGKVAGILYVGIPMAQFESMLSQAIESMAAAAGLAALLVLVLTLLVVRRVTRPLTSVTHSLTALANGQSDVAIECEDRADEIGEIARTVAVFRSNSQERARLRSEQAATTTAAAEQRKAELHSFVEEFRGSVGGILDKVLASSGEFERAARQLTDAARSTADLSAQSAGASESASEHVHSAASASEELSQSISEITRRVQESNEISAEAVRQAEATDQRIAQLSEAGARIGDVVKLITSIAEQTNLLALNATIEAARAGDAGKGFAVVATEVKALAVQTQSATEEITKKIDALQRDAAGSADAVHRISLAIEAIRPVFDTVNGAVAEQNATTSEVSGNAASASEFIISVGESAAEIDAATKAAETHGESVTSAGKAVTTFAQKLKSRCAVLLRQSEHDDRRKTERLPCHLNFATSRGVMPVYEIAMEGVLIGGPDAGRLAPQAMIEGSLEDIGACRLRVVEQSKAGARAQFVGPNAALNEKIEDKLWSIHEENAEFVTRAMEAGNALTKIFEQAVARGEVKMEDLFDTDYVEITGTNPQQYRTRYLDWADRALPPFQEAFLAKDPRMAFCALVDGNGFLPVHNKIYSHPQRPGDVAWNTANSRNRRIFNDPAGLAAARNLRSYLVQSYARDMGNGNTVMMREIDVPIRVKGTALGRIPHGLQAVVPALVHSWARRRARIIL